jgi:hypothetical protein
MYCEWCDDDRSECEACECGECDWKCFCPHCEGCLNECECCDHFVDCEECALKRRATI